MTLRDAWNNLNPLEGRALLERIDQTLSTLARRIERLSERQDSIETHLTRISKALKRAEEQNMAQSEIVTKLVQETAETKGQLASVLTFVRGVPALIQAAIDEALRKNPSLSPEDFAAVTQVIDDLNSSQAEIEEALKANPAPNDPGTTESVDQPKPETEF